MSVYSYLADPRLLPLLDQWEAECRCPVELESLLLELGLVAEAQGAKWATTSEPRPMWFDPATGNDQSKVRESGPSPSVTVADRNRRDWYWMQAGTTNCCDQLPTPVYCRLFCPERGLVTNLFGSFRSAVLAFLTAWKYPNAAD